ncbi:hypothetical protein [Kineosporia babensis]|uniref:Alpha/beta hydrolase n=1 Tax=Kineosporia babensis TaxID=499548 RepID=A0A9X1NGT4_9ACTN|nr:hypothetical protein [Kineosporia babensis]MCD5314852.1 hypothetical protein [Kineosporia babensis]
MNDFLAEVAGEGNFRKSKVTLGQVRLFLLAATVDPAKYTPVITELLKDGALKTESTIERTALSFARVIDDGPALPSNVGFRSEMCQAYGEIDGLAEGDAIARSFADQLGPCTGTQFWDDNLPESIEAQACLIVNEEDLVASPDLIDDYRKAFGPDRLRTVNAPAHELPLGALKALTFTDGGSCR